MSSAITHSEIRSGLRARLIAVPGFPTDGEWEAVAFTPKPGVPWFREQLVPISDTPVSNGVITHLVLYAVTLFYPSGVGPLPIETMAGLLLDAFKVGTRLTQGSTDILCMRVDRAALMPAPQWVSTRVSIRAQTNTLD